jgi:hypothetical protein
MAPNNRTTSPGSWESLGAVAAGPAIAVDM